VIVDHIGSTPIPTYEWIRRRFAEDESVDFSSVITFNLDEYSGLPLDHSLSYHSFMFEAGLSTLLPILFTSLSLPFLLNLFVCILVANNNNTV
jgi:hypothetical protein